MIAMPMRQQDVLNTCIFLSQNFLQQFDVQWSRVCLTWIYQNSSEKSNNNQKRYKSLHSVKFSLLNQKNSNLNFRFNCSWYDNPNCDKKSVRFSTDQFLDSFCSENFVIFRAQHFLNQNLLEQNSQLKMDKNKQNSDGSLTKFWRNLSASRAIGNWI